VDTIVKLNLLTFFRKSTSQESSPWTWSYGSGIYICLCDNCLSPLKLWVWILDVARCTRYNIIWWIVFLGYSGFLH